MLLEPCPSFHFLSEEPTIRAFVASLCWLVLATLSTIEGDSSLCSTSSSFVVPPFAFDPSCLSSSFHSHSWIVFDQLLSFLYRHFRLLSLFVFVILCSGAATCPPPLLASLVLFFCFFGCDRYRVFDIYHIPIMSAILLPHRLLRTSFSF